MTNQLKDKLERLEKFMAKMKERADAPIPLKHLTRAAQFKAFIKKEIEDTKRQIDSIKLGEGNVK